EAPVWRARTLMAAPPAQKLATICAVTSCGHGVTPSATTPWSAANTATAAGAGTGGGDVPAMAASCTASASIRPSEPGGLVRRSRCSAAAAAAWSSGGVKAASAAEKSPGTSGKLSEPGLDLGRLVRLRPTLVPVVGVRGVAVRGVGVAVRVLGVAVRWRGVGVVHDEQQLVEDDVLGDPQHAEARDVRGQQDHEARRASNPVVARHLPGLVAHDEREPDADEGQPPERQDLRK